MSIYISRSASFTRPANTTAYSAGALIANSTVAGSVVPLEIQNIVPEPGHSIRIRSVTLGKSGPATGMLPPFQIFLFNRPPIVSVGDGGAFLSYVANSGMAQLLAVDDARALVFAAATGLYFTGAAGAIGTDASPALGGVLGDTFVPATGRSAYALVSVGVAATSQYVPISGEQFTVTVQGEWSE